MIIQEVKTGKKLFFLIEETVLITDNGKIFIKERLDDAATEKLNTLLKGFNLGNSDDFTKMKKILSDFPKEYNVIETAIFNHIKKPWSFFNPENVQVPRPISVVFKKEKGIREYVVFSLNAYNFDGAVNANRHISDYIKNKINNETSLKEENMLMLLREAIDNEHELVGFELRLGIVFNNYHEGRYIYEDKELDKKEQFEFVSKLIKEYSIAYVENPFFYEDTDNYKKLLEKYKSSCLICINNTKYDYKKVADEKIANAVVVNFSDISTFKSDTALLKEKKINIIADESHPDVVVGLQIPLIKLTDDSEGDKKVRRIGTIVSEIAEYQKA